MSKADALKLIKSLLQLVDDEEAYKREFERKMKSLKDDVDNATQENKTWRQHVYWNYAASHRTPTKAMTRDALRIISRLSARAANDE